MSEASVNHELHRDLDGTCKALAAQRERLEEMGHRLSGIGIDIAYAIGQLKRGCADRAMDALERALENAGEITLAD